MLQPTHRVIAFYIALVLWVALLVVGYRRRKYGAFLHSGVALTVLLNLRYFEGPAKAISFFVGIYDVLHNAGVTDPASARALAPCLVGDDCSVWGDRYPYHPSWGVAFYRRFAQGEQPRTNLLYLHIFFNTLTFVLMMIQLYQPGDGPHRRQHRVIGYVSFASLMIGVVRALLLAAEHGTEIHYGGQLSTWGFRFMAFCVGTCAIMGIRSIRRKDVVAHQAWMIRFVGSMWGSFWFFRATEFVLGPSLVKYDTVSILLCVWLSAPLGIIIAEAIRKGILQREISVRAKGM